MKMVKSLSGKDVIVTPEGDEISPIEPIIDGAGFGIIKETGG